MKPFVVNRHGRIVFPYNFLPQLDFAVFDTLDDLEHVIRRDFSEKARTESDIVARLDAGAYTSRYDLCRDMALNLFWRHRYLLTMYEPRPTRWRDVPRHRADVFLPAIDAEDSGDGIAVIETSGWALPSAWDGESEERLFGLLLDVLRRGKAAGTGIPVLNPRVAEAVEWPRCLAYRLSPYDPDWPRYSEDDIVGYSHPVPELEALTRHTMVLHNQFPWDPAAAGLLPVGELRADDVVVVLHPRHPDVHRFIRRLRGSAPPLHRAARAPAEPRSVPREPRSALPVAPIDVRRRFRVMPRLEALAVRKGERTCTNEDLVRNAAYCWSPMTAADILEKTGIEQRLYTEHELGDIALQAAERALEKSARRPEEIGGVIFCSCTSGQGCPSVAAWLAGQLGMLQTHAAFDVLAACAGLPYGLGETVRLLQDTERPVLLVCAEKFSDKIGTVRASRMIFGDGAAALVVGPAPAGAPPDIEILQTYASGPLAEVTSILWPDPLFDNSISVYGPEVRSMVRRYLAQMAGELGALPHPDGGRGSCLDAVDLIVPHQANQTMVAGLARSAGLGVERFYFDIERVGNTSAASIPIALHDAARDGVIDRPLRVFTPAFGAGAVAGYAVMRVDPAIMA